MEIISFLTAFLLLISFMLIKHLRKSKAIKSTMKLPPGPRPLPIIGNIHQLFGSPMHQLLRDMAKKYGPMMHLKFGEVPTIVVTSPQVAKEIYKTHDILFSSRSSHCLAFKIITYDFGDIIFAPYGSYWRALRKICTLERLSSKRVQTFRSIRENEVFNLIKSISTQKGSLVNLSKRIFSLTFGITSRIAFGERNRYTEKYIELLEEVNKLASGFCLADMYPSSKLFPAMSTMRYKMEAIHKKVDEILENILNDHKRKIVEPKHARGEAKEDLVDVLLNIQESGEFNPQLTDKDIKAVIFDLFSAGGDTSSTTMEWAFSEMIKNPKIIKRAQDEVRNVFGERGNVDESSLHELKYLQAIIKETLRLRPSAPLLLPRECSEQCEVNGYCIPAKARVIFNAWAMGRDPMYWVEPEKFNPERFLDSKVDFKGNDFEYIPFGAGRRICPGISFALPNIELPLAQLLFHFDWKLPGELKQEELDMSEDSGVSIKRKNDLCLIPIPFYGSCLGKGN